MQNIGIVTVMCLSESVGIMLFSQQENTAIKIPIFVGLCQKNTQEKEVSNFSCRFCSCLQILNAATETEFSFNMSRNLIIEIIKDFIADFKL